MEGEKHFFSVDKQDGDWCEHFQCFFFPLQQRSVISGLEISCTIVSKLHQL